MTENTCFPSVVQDLLKNLGFRAESCTENIVVATEAVKISLHDGERREFLRDLPPLAAGRLHVEDGLHNSPLRGRPEPDSMPRHR